MAALVRLLQITRLDAMSTQQLLEIIADRYSGGATTAFLSHIVYSYSNFVLRTLIVISTVLWWLSFFARVSLLLFFDCPIFNSFTLLFLAASPPSRTYLKPYSS
jgi:hypothetical protein